MSRVPRIRKSGRQLNMVKAISILIFFSFLLGFWILPTSNPQQRADKTLPTDPEMVFLPVVVTNQEGEYITNLRKEDFRIFEDGVEQDIYRFETPDEPIVIALLLDTSGSEKIMLRKIQNAALDFTDQRRPKDEVGVFSFDENVRFHQQFSVDRIKNRNEIKKINSGGYTAIYDAVWIALEKVLAPIAKRKALIALTDGVDTHSKGITRAETLQAAKRTQATIYCIYYNTIVAQFGSLMAPGTFGDTGPNLLAAYAAGREYLEELSEDSGGLVFDGSKDLRYAFGEISKELESQYSISYFPTNGVTVDKSREVEVKMVRPDLKARTKKVITPRKS